MNQCLLVDKEIQQSVIANLYTRLSLSHYRDREGVAIFFFFKVDKTNCVGRQWHKRQK